MDRSIIEARINQGLAIAANVMGEIWTVYRPVSAMAPLAAPLMILQAAIAADVALRMNKPAGFGDAIRYLAGDASALQTGDYLQGDAVTLFVASIDGMAPVMLVECNVVMDLFQWVGDAGYGGGVEQPVAQGWPASVMLSGRGSGNPASLPGDAREDGWRVLMPVIPGVVVTRGMVFVDGSGLRYLASGVEETALGLRIEATSIGS